MAIKEFSEKYNLGITFQSLGMKENDFSGNAWYYRIAKLGQLFLRIEDTSIIYMPENLSLFQINWLNSHKDFLVKRRKNLALVVLDEEENVVVSKSPSVENPSAVFKLLFKIVKEQEKFFIGESEELKR